jgi:DNA (cytosine-5)-methyltransferase 1
MEKAQRGCSLRTIDLYAGAGGLALGFQLAGFEVVAAFDNWKPAIDTMKRNFQSTEVVTMNLDTFSGDATPFTKFKPDVIIGGPPCQDFSHAGKRNEDLGRGKLTVTFAEIVTALKTKWFVMENVDRILKTQKYLAVKAAFKKSKYGITERVLDASLCGVPQKRKRFFMIGELYGTDDAVMPYLEKSLTTKPTTLRDYFGSSLGTEYYYRHPRNYQRRAVYSIDEPSPTIRGVNRPIPSTYKKHPRDAVEIGKEVRPLTTRERSCIQTFPKDYRFAGSMTEQEQMIGNAVPVKLAEYVAKCIIDYMKQKRLDACLENTLSDKPVANSP